MPAWRGGDGFRKAMSELGRGLENPPKLRVGFLSGATYPDGTPVAFIALIQDGGAPRAGIPPRPFFRNMIAKKQGEWPPAIGQLLVDHDWNVQKVLELAGDAIEGQLKQSILDTNAPPLAQSTIDRKGFAKPLIETSHLINSTGHEVVRK